MSMVHPHTNHQGFPAPGNYARPTTPSPSNTSTTANVTVPPPLVSTLAMSPPSFVHRHTSPFPESQTISFSALGPAETLSNPPPPAPKVVTATLPDVPTVATDRHVPAAFPPTPDLSAPDHQVLYPDAMIKLAPPADDMEPALGKMKEMAVVEGGIARLPLNSLDHLVGDQVPAQRTRSRSQQLLGIPCAVDPVASARGKSASPRPKPPKRSHTAHPSHSFRSSTPSGPDVRIRLQSNVSGLPRSKFSPLGPNSASSSMHRSYTSESVTPRFLSVPIEHSASDFGPSDGVEAKIAFLGDPSVGKTSMIMRYIKKRYIADPSATIQGTLYISKIIANGVKVKLQIWDTAGQERFGNMTALYYRHSHVCVLVYDVSNRQTFLDLKEVLDELKDRVPDAAIYIVGHKSDREANRAVYPAEARAAIRLWRRPPVPITTTTLTPPSKKGGMFRSLSSASKHAEEAPKTVTTARSHSFDGLAVMAPEEERRNRPIVPPPTITLASPVTSRYPYSPSPASGSVPFPRSSTPTHRPTSSTAMPSGILRSPTSPTMVTFPPHVAPSTPTSAMTTEHASLISFPPYQKGKGSTGPFYTSEFGQRDFQTTPASAAKTAVGRHGASAGRFSISGYLGWGRAAPEESAGAVSSLARLAEGNPTSRYDDHRRPSDPFRHSADPSTTTFGSSLMGSSRFDSRRKSEQWTSRIGWGGAEPSPSSDPLGEFREGVKKKQSGEMQSGPMASLPHRATRSRGGSLGRDSRLHDEDGPVLDWGVDIEGIRFGECSALTGAGIEEMFKSISTLLAAKKDRLEKEQILRKKNSVILTAPAEPDEVQGQGYTCCAI